MHKLVARKGAEPGHVILVTSHQFCLREGGASPSWDLPFRPPHSLWVLGSAWDRPVMAIYGSGRRPVKLPS